MEIIDMLAKLFGMAGLLLTILIVPLIKTLINLNIEITKLNMKIEYLEKTLTDLASELNLLQKKSKEDR